MVSGSNQAPQPKSQEHPDCELDGPQNRAMFSAIVKRYDLLNTLTSCGLDHAWRSHLVGELGPRENEAYLDLGAGTCKLAGLIHQAAPRARVVALDQCLPMLTLGVKRPREGESADLTGNGQNHSTAFVAGDALNLPLGANTFNGIVSAFCLRNFPDRRKAFAEACRVLAPGGRIFFLDLSRPRGRVLGLLHSLYMATWIRMLGSLLSSPGAYAYLRRSIIAFPPAEIITGELQAEGFTAVQAKSISTGIVTLWRAQKEPT